MHSKTPQFDALLDAMLAELVPHKRVCLWKGEHDHCEGEFMLEEGDIEFLRMLRVPAPNHCPTCRRMRRFVHMGVMRLFKRDCNAPGHGEQVISIFPQECPFPVYDYDYTASDAFEPFDFGTDYMPGASALEQLFAMRKTFPLPAFINRDGSSINCEYSNGGRASKNCYYTSGAYLAEDVWYSGLVNKSKEVMSSRAVADCDTVYEVLGANSLYKTSFAFFSKDCSDSTLLFDCRNCTNCFGCVNLRNKSNCIFNEQKTKEEYDAFMAANTPLSYKALQEHTERFWQLVKSVPINASRNTAFENVSGVLIENSRDVHDATDSKRAEHVRHADGALTHHDSMDILFSGGSELLYECTNVGSSSSRVKFSISSKFTTDSEFVFNSMHVSNCFMCFGLTNKSYCVLNKQYAPEEYWPLVDAIKTEMLKGGEYGEHPNMAFSAQAYNMSLAGLYYPIPDETALKFGAFISEEPDTNAGSIETIAAADLPDTIAEVDDSILSKAISCQETGRPFRIIPTELAFYRKLGVPLPRIHPNVRLDRLYRFSPTGLRYYTSCANCGKDIQSLFDPKDGYLLCCESCYQKEVI